MKIQKDVIITHLAIPFPEGFVEEVMTERYDFPLHLAFTSREGYTTKLAIYTAMLKKCYGIEPSLDLPGRTVKLTLDTAGVREKVPDYDRYFDELEFRGVKAEESRWLDPYALGREMEEKSGYCATFRTPVCGAGVVRSHPPLWDVNIGVDKEEYDALREIARKRRRMFMKPSLKLKEKLES